MVLTATTQRKQFHSPTIPIPPTLVLCAASHSCWLDHYLFSHICFLLFSHIMKTCSYQLCLCSFLANAILVVQQQPKPLVFKSLASFYRQSNSAHNSWFLIAQHLFHARTSLQYTTLSTFTRFCPPMHPAHGCHRLSFCVLFAKLRVLSFCISR